MICVPGQISGKFSGKLQLQKVAIPAPVQCLAAIPARAYQCLSIVFRHINMDRLSPTEKKLLGIKGYLLLRKRVKLTLAVNYPKGILSAEDLELPCILPSFQL